MKLEAGKRVRFELPRFGISDEAVVVETANVALCRDCKDRKLHPVIVRLNDKSKLHVHTCNLRAQ